MKPTETDIQIAKQYLLERLDAERSMLYHLERLMRKAAEDIVALLYAKGISVDTLKYNRLQKQVEESINEIILFKFRKFNLLISDCKIWRYEPVRQSD